MTIQTEALPVATSLAERVQSLRSSSGIEAWLVEDHTTPILSMAFAFRGGCVRDPDGKAGTARMLAELMTEGAGPLDGGAFKRALGDKAIRLTFGAQNDSLQGQLQTLSRNADAAFDLLGLALRDPSFAPDAIVRVRNATAAWLRTSLGNSNQVALRAFFAHGFPGHPYGRPMSGDLTTLAVIGREDIVGLHKDMFTRGNLQVAVVGGIDAATLGRALDRAFGDLPSAATLLAPKVVLSGLGERIVTRLDGPQSTIYFGRPGIRRTDPDFHAATVVNYCLGSGGFNSRLFQEVREKRGLCYSIWAGQTITDGATTFMGSTSTPNDHVEEVLAIVSQQIARLLNDGLDTDELEKAKTYLIGSYGMNFDSSASIANLLLGLKLNMYEKSWIEERDRWIAAVTQEDVARVTRRLFADGSMLVSMAGDLSKT